MLLVSSSAYAYVYTQQSQTITLTIKHKLTDAFIAYRDTTTTLNTVKSRTWTGNTSSWTTQSELPNAGSPVRTVRVAYCPIQARSYEKIVVTLSDDGYLDANVWNGTAWITTSNIGFVGTTGNAYRPFDICYEKTTGNALLAYGVFNSNPHRDLGYKQWNFNSGWSSEQYMDDPLKNDVDNYWIEMASNPTIGSNEITVVCLSSDGHSEGCIWNNSSWEVTPMKLDTNVANLYTECIAVAYEQQSGTAWTAVGSASVANTFSIRSHINGSWNATKTNPNVGNVPNWCTLKADPSSNKLMLVSVGASSHLDIIYWAGAGSWTVNGGSPAFTEDAAVDTSSQRCADFAWEPTASKGLLVWGTTAGQIRYQPFDGAGWGTSSDTAMGVYIHPWVQLKTNTRSLTGDSKILGGIMGGTNFDIGVVKWDGSTFSVVGENIVSANAGLVTYECFELEFKNYA